MSANPVARVYAEALFGIARERSLVDDMGQELEEFLALVRQDRDLEVFLTSPVLDPGEKVARIKVALSGRMDDTVADFLCLLVEKRRIGALSRIVDAYRDLADEHAGRTRVSVRTASPLDESLRSEIGSVLRASLARDIVIESEVEPAILGGAVVSIGDKVYDGSIRSRLKAFRNQIMRSGGYEDQG
jgi:F-type H+-transporting ATPase subunit delta